MTPVDCVSGLRVSGLRVSGLRAWLVFRISGYFPLPHF